MWPCDGLGVERLSPEDRWDRLQPPRDLTDGLSGYRKWMNGNSHYRAEVPFQGNAEKGPPVGSLQLSLKFLYSLSLQAEI